ncbi:MAG: hypothetical protein VXY20_08860 [Pseudomonadota bacterium]|nr:hypothetical protein [Pseudomonadota bacterium]
MVRALRDGLSARTPWQGHLAGDISLEEAAARSKTATRQFAKRQMTWFKNQIIADKTLSAQYLESFSDEIFSFIRSFLLTDSG